MKSEAVKLAEKQERMAAYKALADTTTAVLTNPVITVVGSTILIEYLQSSIDNDPDSPTYRQRIPRNGYVGSAAGSALEAALIVYLGASTLGKFTQDLKPVAEAIAPLLLTKGVV